jgi:hypothetical protein
MPQIFLPTSMASFDRVSQKKQAGTLAAASATGCWYMTKSDPPGGYRPAFRTVLYLMKKAVFLFQIH